MKLAVEKYSTACEALPKSGEYLCAQINSGCVVVYQAFNDRIADFAIENQCFGGEHYRFQRMTWIKPGFLWMMYRSGWAAKPNQERILAVSFGLSDFMDFFRRGVHSSYVHEKYVSYEDWIEKLGASEIRLQWDPDHGPKGEKLERKAIQIGLKGKELELFNNRIVQIEDITDFVRKQKAFVDAQQMEQLLVPKERVIPY